LSDRPRDRGGSREDRESLYRAEYCRQAYRLALLGLTDKQMADVFGVTEPILSSRKHEHADFRQTLLDGKVIADSEVAESLYKRSLGWSHESSKVVRPAAKTPVVVRYIERFPPDTLVLDTRCIARVSRSS
jgi:hypothetical protein